ncbi:unnamed protein product [Gongylonema pulchrum]|uniref:TIMELESS-interacting protein n=1 Tax=Gongylonema pulchrum TaxID=637853 RepID=A0A183D7C4_9BILA|nr:unnamed protein product [Gongylonema pulchrum]
MNRVEHWAHLLHPKLRFEDFVSRTESLSEKRMIKTMMTKMRLEMPLTDEDFIKNKENAVVPEAEVKNQHSPDRSLENLDLFEIFGDKCENPAPASTQPHKSPSPRAAAVPTLTEEQLQRIQRNKLRAQKLRAEREAQIRHSGKAYSVTKEETLAESQAEPSSVSSVVESNAVTADLGQQELVEDVLMDDDEALDFIFSAA